MRGFRRANPPTQGLRVECRGRGRAGAVRGDGAVGNGRRGLDDFESLRERRQLRRDFASEQRGAEGHAEGAVLPAIVIRGRGLPVLCTGGCVDVKLTLQFHSGQIWLE